jgi:cell division septation protein DedD
MDWVTEKMYQARLLRNRMQKQEQPAASIYPVEPNTVSTTNRPAQRFHYSQKLSWLIVGLVSGAMIVIVVWWTQSIDSGDSAEVHPLESRLSEQLRQPVELQAGSSTAEDKSEDHKENHVAGAISRLEILPPPAAGGDNVSTTADMGTDKSGNPTSSDLHTKIEHLPAAVEIQPLETMRGTGPWAINLVSLQNKADAEQFVAQANSRGVAAEIYQVTVHGKNYWRVQVPDFSSAAEARAKAGQVKEKLGLKDVWIVKR